MEHLLCAKETNEEAPVLSDALSVRGNGQENDQIEPAGEEPLAKLQVIREDLCCLGGDEWQVVKQMEGKAPRRAKGLHVQRQRGVNELCRSTPAMCGCGMLKG